MFFVPLWKRLETVATHASLAGAHHVTFVRHRSWGFVLESCFLLLAGTAGFGFIAYMELSRSNVIGGVLILLMALVLVISPLLWDLAGYETMTIDRTRIVRKVALFKLARSETYPLRNVSAVSVLPRFFAAKYLTGPQYSFLFGLRLIGTRIRFDCGGRTVRVAVNATDAEARRLAEIIRTKAAAAGHFYEG